MTNTFGERFLVPPSRGDPAPARRGGCSSCRPPASQTDLRPRAGATSSCPAARPGQHARGPGRSRTSCSCATRWPTWPGRSSGSSRARSSGRAIASTRNRDAGPARGIRRCRGIAAYRLAHDATGQLGAAAARCRPPSGAPPEARQGAAAGRLAAARRGAGPAAQPGRRRRPLADPRGGSPARRRPRDAHLPDSRVGRTAARTCGSAGASASAAAKVRAACASIASCRPPSSRRPDCPASPAKSRQIALTSARVVGTSTRTFKERRARQPGGAGGDRARRRRPDDRHRASRAMGRRCRATCCSSSSLDLSEGAEHEPAVDDVGQRAGRARRGRRRPLGRRCRGSRAARRCAGRAPGRSATRSITVVQRVP